MDDLCTLKCWKEDQENMKLEFIYEDFLKEEKLKKENKN
jgi:hypothetical protein